MSPHEQASFASRLCGLCSQRGVLLLLILSSFFIIRHLERFHSGWSNSPARSIALVMR
ncbi:hypothetical protein N656DRAFT_85453 [Canariomyces notabilis]|uniref:Uncharacterized protein n=1 Tax=Canariomyces notabilis TaxID=2074819 RepID=A0AAN6TDC4_9PEZI|nr:hypothetical protein N656DRAFT_85453 [Canariomyces arenarius]